MGQLPYLKAWKLQLRDDTVAALAERVADRRYDVVFRKWFTAGRSGAPVALVLRSAPGRSEQLVLKFCDVDGRARVLNLRTGWDESPGFREHMAKTKGGPIPLNGDWRAVFMHVARGNLLTMAPLADLYERENFPGHCATVVRSVLCDWNENQFETETIDAGVLIERMMGRRGAAAEEWAGKVRIALDEPVVQREGWPDPLPNPFAFVRGSEGKRKVEALAVGKAHGDLSGRNVLIPTEEGVAAKEYVLIDYDRYCSRAPLARDPMHLLVALILDRFGQDELGLLPTFDLAEVVVNPREKKARSLEPVRELSVAIHNASAELARRYGLEGEFQLQCLLSLIGVGLVHMGRKLHVRDEIAVKEWCFSVAALAAEKYLRIAPELEPDDVAAMAAPAVRAMKAQPELVDRADVLGVLRNRLVNGPGGVVVVRGQRGVGKTAIVHTVLHELANGTTRTHLHTVNPLIGMDAGTLAGYVAGESDAAAGHTGLHAVAGLEAVLQQLGDSRVVVVLDSAENLVGPETGILDPDLDKALELLATRHGHRVTVLLVTNRDLESATASVWPHTDDPISVRRLPSEYFVQYLDSLSPAGRAVSADLPDEIRQQLHGQLQGNPRLAELAHAVVVFAETGLDFPALAKVLLKQNPREVGTYLVQTLFAGLTPVQQQVLRALALFGTPVPESAVIRMCDEEVSNKARQALKTLTANRIVRLVDGEYSVLPEDGRLILARIQDKSELRRLYRAAALCLIPLRNREPRGINDLRVHFAELKALVEVDSPGEIFDRLEMISKVLREWNCASRLREPRERIRDRLDEFPRMVNENALGGIYVSVSRFDLADEAYGKALAIARDRGADKAKAKLFVNLAAMYWQQNDTERALWYYELARDEARRLDRPGPLMAAFEGIADCHRRRGHYEQAIGYAENALAVPGLTGYPDTPQAHRDAITGSVAVTLKLARWSGELGRLDDAERLIEVAESTAKGQLNNWLAASCLDGRADLQYDQGDYPQAEMTAQQAVTQAQRLRDPVTLLQARTTLCFTYLRMDRPGDAYAEIESAQRYRGKRRSLVVLALHGLAARWKRDHAEAERRFGQLQKEASARIDRDNEDFAAKDFLGLAKCGLRMDSRDDDLSDAILDFEQARAQTPPTPVLVDRLRLMLTLLAESCSRRDRLRPVIDVLSDPSGRIG